MAKRTLKRSNIGYLGTGADGRPIDKVFAWNPGGEGCSNGCDGCWARAIAKRNVHCEDCRAFRVHLHKERLCEPANTKTPRLVLVNFTCDTFDEDRPGNQVTGILRAASEAPWHRYVLLTQRYVSASGYTPYYIDCDFYWGITISNEDVAVEGLQFFDDVPCRWWISYEPASADIPWESHFDNLHGLPEGIIIGHDRRKGAPGTDTLSHIRSCVEQCKAAGVNWWVKQIWVRWCGKCGKAWGSYDITNQCSHLHMDWKPAWKWRLLHASKPDEYALFPEDLKGGRLLWSAPKEQSDENP